MCVRNYPKNIENEAIVRSVVMKSPKTPYPLNIQNMKSSFILHLPLFIGVPE